MNINVTKTQVTITNEYILNDKEYNVNQCSFTFSQEYTQNLVKKAIFVQGTSIVEEPIINNECLIPSEVLNRGTFELRVYAYEIQDEELVLRYSPTPTLVYVRAGSYIEGAESPEVITPSQFEQYMQAMNDGLNQVANVDIEAEELTNGMRVIITNRYGEQKIIYVYDGKNLEFEWQGTSLGVRQEGQTEYQFVNLKGDKGDAGAIKMIIVQELPATGQDDTIYLVPLEEPESQENKYAEYIYVDNAWELLGKIGIQVDLTDYVKNTDYATSSKGGVVKIDQNYGLRVSGGTLIGYGVNYTDYQNALNQLVIDKGTLENVITGKGIVDSTKIKTTTDTTQGNVYDVTYINSLIGDINTALDTINGEQI